MSKLSPFGALLVCSAIGLLTHKFGLWFPIGIVAFLVVSVMQNRRTG
ncbi:hypothetical protein [Novosphingobium pokkalii]|uniref:Uncharacterized protein n=1 Tax=Novosphingobium pokkalii TaxID=1770194 RepID=A0ABV7UXR9_9SPHN|nr:hypothetical protein [Novosphingobium pokkalii]GHC94375.1 hypothetical protein GCM10019060_22370 [Novosphingobium pokkalii]